MAESPLEQLTTKPPENLSWQPSDEDRALVKKWQPYITTIMDMTPDKKKAVSESIGLDPNEIKSRPDYKDLQERNRQNEIDMAAARSKVNKVTIGALIASVGTSIAGYFYSTKKAEGSNSIRTIITSLLASFTTIGTLSVATKVFTRKPAKEGMQLTQEALAAEMVEIARALDRKGAAEAPGAAIPDSQNPVTELLKQQTTEIHGTNMDPKFSAIPPLPTSYRERRTQEQQNAAQAPHTVGV